MLRSNFYLFHRRLQDFDKIIWEKPSFYLLIERLIIPKRFGGAVIKSLCFGTQSTFMQPAEPALFFLKIPSQH